MSMNLETLLQSLPSREDLASAIGLETRSTSSEILPALSLFGTGMLFGAGLALLFAPKSGSELRRDLSEGIQQYGYGQGDESSRQMASQNTQDSSRYSSQGQQDYPRQMSGQTSSEQSRQMSGQTHSSSQGRQQTAGSSDQHSESDASRTRTPGTGSRNI